MHIIIYGVCVCVCVCVFILWLHFCIYMFSLCVGGPDVDLISSVLEFSYLIFIV